MEGLDLNTTGPGWKAETCYDLNEREAALTAETTE